MRCTVSATSLTCEVGAACCLLPAVVVHHHWWCTTTGGALPTAQRPAKFLAALAHAGFDCDSVHAWEALQ